MMRKTEISGKDKDLELQKSGNLKLIYVTIGIQNMKGI